MSDEDKKPEETAAADTEGTEEAAAAAATAAPAEEEKATEEAAPAAADTEEAPAEEAPAEEEAVAGEAPAAAAVEPKSSAEGDGAQDKRPLRKTRVGVVISDKMDKTIVINVVRRVAHPRFKKIIKQSTKLYAHDEEEAAKVGDKVRVMEARPLSKRKRWRLVEVLSH